MLEQRIKARTRITEEILNKISRIDELKGEWHGGIRMEPHILERLRFSSLVANSGASSRIEKMEITDADIVKILRSYKKDKGIIKTFSRDMISSEVLGYLFILEQIFKNYHSIKISENSILHFHDMLFRFSNENTGHKGKYKSGQNAIGHSKEEILFTPIPPYLVKGEMDALTEWLNQNLQRFTDKDPNNDTHPLIVIMNFIYEFLSIHPFTDGNGRLSRALTNLLLLKYGYTYSMFIPIDSLIENRKNEYYEALKTSQANYAENKINFTEGSEDISSWVNFMLSVFEEQAKLAEKLLEKEAPNGFLSPIQEDIYAEFVDNEKLSIEDLDERFADEIPDSVFEKVLKTLKTFKLIKRSKSEKDKKYSINNDIIKGK